jgi:hypothetical protein
VPAIDLGLPISRKRSARWRTVSSPLSKSISDHRSPRSSEARSPVKAAVSSKARHGLPSTDATSARTSPSSGMSMPISSLWACLALLRCRFFLLLNDAATTFWATSPASWASPRIAPRMAIVFLTRCGERLRPDGEGSVASQLRNATISGAVSFESLR